MTLEAHECANRLDLIRRRNHGIRRLLQRGGRPSKEAQSYFQKSGRGGITKGLSLVVALMLLMTCFAYFSHLTLTRSGHNVEGRRDAPHKQTLDKARAGGFSWEGKITRERRMKESMLSKTC